MYHFNHIFNLNKKKIMIYFQHKEMKKIFNILIVLWSIVNNMTLIFCQKLILDKAQKVCKHLKKESQNIFKTNLVLMLIFKLNYHNNNKISKNNSKYKYNKTIKWILVKKIITRINNKSQKSNKFNNNNINSKNSQ